MEQHRGQIPTILGAVILLIEVVMAVLIFNNSIQKMGQELSIERGQVIRQTIEREP